MNLSEFYVLFLIHFTFELDVQIISKNYKNSGGDEGGLVLTRHIFRTKQDTQLRFAPLDSVYFWFIFAFNIESLHIV